MTTPGVAAALEVRVGEHLLVAEDADGLAAATLALLRDPVRARPWRWRPTRVVERRYRWAASARSGRGRMGGGGRRAGSRT